MIKPKLDLHIIGRASTDAKVEMAGDRPVCKFSIWIGSGKNKESGEYQKPFFYSVKCWGDQAKHVKKGHDVELFGYLTRREYVKDGVAKTWDEVVVKTNEQGQPQINFPGMEYGGTKGVSDEAVASGKSPVIQTKKTEPLEITDDDIPF